MAEQSRLHVWLNTAIACSALIAVGISDLISWKTYSFNIESFGFNSDFTYDCPFKSMTSVGKGDFHTTVGLCWQLTIANQSTSRVSTLGYEAATSEGHSSTPLVVEVDDRKGKQLLLPMSFDGGEARTVLVQVDLPITNALGKIIADTMKSQTKRIETLADAASIAAQAKLDVLGNPVSVSQIGGYSLYLIQFPADYKKTIVSFRVDTGRENVFATHLVYPSALAGFVSSNNVH